MTAASNAPQRAVSSRRAWAMVLLMGLLYLLSFLDRFILAMVARPIREDLGISAVEMGFLFGTAFALFYGILGLPLARLADRANRVRLIVVGALLWSICTVASSFATSYAQLVALRIGLAIGEAMLSPAAYSLIADLFPAARRSRAASIYTSFGMLGGGSSFVIGGALIGLFSGPEFDLATSGWRVWQAVFLAVGLPTVMLALVFAAIAREPARGQDVQGVPLAELGRDIVRRFPVLGLMIIGGGFSQLPGGALAAWLPTYIEDRFATNLASVGLAIGLVKIISAPLGALTVPVLAERQRRKGIVGGSAATAAGATALGCMVLALACFMPNLTAFIVASGVALCLLSGASATIITSFQHDSGDRARATMTAICLMSFTMIGMGIGPLLFGIVQDSGLGPLHPASGLLAVILVGVTIACACLFSSAAAARREAAAPSHSNQI